MNFNKDVFREYDVRGIADVDFSGDFAFYLGKAFGSYVFKNNKNKISISGDVRLSTQKLKKDFTRGLIESGINVVDIGVLPTPINYFYVTSTSNATTGNVEGGGDNCSAGPVTLEVVNG